MKKMVLVMLCVVLTIFVYAGETVKAKSKIFSISLFKNGLAVVKQTLYISKTGKYLIEDVPEPVHGTFWIESKTKLKTRLTNKEFIVEGDKPLMNLEETFAGRNVKIHLKGEPPTIIKGKVQKFDFFKRKEQWDRTYRQNTNYYYRRRTNTQNRNIQNVNSRFIILKTDRGIIYLDSSMISYIESDSVNSIIKRTRPILIFEVERVPQNGETIHISYLTKGISWAPSYKIDLRWPRHLIIKQKAVIKNEFSNFKDTDINLISGFPNIKFAQVTSPLSLKTNWSHFFQQLNQRFQPTSSSLRNVAVQQAVAFNRPATTTAGLDLSKNEGEGVDIHYESIGKISMKEGDSFAVNVDQKRSEYERIVEWIIPDTRDQWGRYVEEHQRRQNPEKYQDAAWDSIRFKNPFKFPMTTAAASIYEKGKFLGQSLSLWVNPGSKTVLHITKALSIITRNTEKEVMGKREKLYIGGRRFQKTQVEGRIYMKNYRKKAVKLLIRRKFSGKLISAEGKPKCDLLEIGVYSVNERNELTWEFELKAEEEKTLKYKYSLLAYY